MQAFGIILWELLTWEVPWEDETPWQARIHSLWASLNYLGKSTCIEGYFPGYLNAAVQLPQVVEAVTLTGIGERKDLKPEKALELLRLQCNLNSFSNLPPHPLIMSYQLLRQRLRLLSIF